MLKSPCLAVTAAFIATTFGTSSGLCFQIHSPKAPSAQLHGSSLARHDFLYAGESHDRRIFIVRNGQIVWRYDDPAGKGEISDAVMLSNGNILFAHQFGVTEITPDKKIIWNYEPPAGHEVHTAMPIGHDRVLYIQNGEQALLRVVNIVTGVTEKELPLETKHPISVHGQFRHARLTQQGTLLVAHMDLNKVVEYDATGKVLRSIPASTPWGVTPLGNGNVLITDKQGVREINPRGDAVWSFTPADAPGYPMPSMQQAWRLANGNTVVDNWSNEWNPGTNSGPETLQAIELTLSKQVVWTLKEWTQPNNLGPATTLQFLDQPSAPENVHFGDIH